MVKLVQAYVGKEWDRVRSIDVMSAIKELDEAVRGPQLEDQEQAIDKAAQTARDEADQSDKKAEEYDSAAREILGVGPRAEFVTIRRAYEKLSRRAQPENFLPESEEARQADQLLRRVTWAYTYLTKGMTPSEKRFRSLEIE